MKFYISVAKGLKLKARKFLELNPTFVEVTGERLVAGGGDKNRVKQGDKFSTDLLAPYINFIENKR